MSGFSSMNTPAKAVRGLGSAKDGTEHFWRQRITALANVPLIIGFVFLIACVAGEDHATVVEKLAHPFSAILMLAVVLSGIIHMRLGMQVIIEDYIHGENVKLVLLVANTLFSAGIALAAVFAILKIAFGA